MLICSKRMPQARGLAPALLRRSPSVMIDWDTRQKSRFEATDSLGRALGVFLPRGSVVRGGDVLVAEDGSLIRVEAAPQPVLRITTAPSANSHWALMRAAYHLGNRHVPIELQADHLKIEPDHVLAELMRQMGMEVQEVQAAFEPEAGAYGYSALLGHDHGHGHDGHLHTHHGAGGCCDHDHSHDHPHHHPHGH